LQHSSGGGGGIQRIIAIIKGQEGIIGPRTLNLALWDESWWHGSQGSENIVGEFEENSDWCLEPPGFPCAARNWIIAQVNTYPGAKVIIIGHSNGADGARRVAKQLTDYNITVDLLYLFDLVPKPWRWEDPATEPPLLPVTNVNTTICLYQRDDVRRLGKWWVYMQGWRVSPGTNTQWHTLNPEPQPSTMEMKYTIEGEEHRINCYPHSEMIFNKTNKDNLSQAIDDIKNSKEIPMKYLLRAMIISWFGLINNTDAIETEIIATVGDKTVTNIDVLESMRRHLDENVYWSPNVHKSNFIELVNRLLFEQYAEKHRFPVTHEQVVEKLTQETQREGYNVEVFFRKFGGETGIRDSQIYKLTYRNMLEWRCVEHFDPNILVVTEEDIQNYIADSKKRGGEPDPIGEPERVHVRAISVGPPEQSDNLRAMLPELEAIRKRINQGQKYDDIKQEYLGRKEFFVADYVMPYLTDYLEKFPIRRQGLDALVPWKNLKGKAVIVSDSEGKAYSVWVVEDYTPDTRMSLEKAAVDPVRRQEVIRRVQGWKFTSSKKRFIETQTREMLVYAYPEQELYQRLADQYETWWIEKNRSDPNFPLRLEAFQKNKERKMH
jgi:hypothetical protein